MLDFLIVGARRACALIADEPFISSIRAMRAAETNRSAYYRIGPLRVWLWHTSTPPYTRLEDQVSSGHGLTILRGHAYRTDTLQPVRDVISAAAAGGSLGGNYCILRVAPNGSGAFDRSDISLPPIYYGDCRDYYVISSRSSMAAAAYWHHRRLPLDSDCIRWLCSYSVASNNHSPFAGVRCLSVDERLSFDSDGLRIERVECPLLSSELQRRYRADRQAYWDDTYDALLASMRLTQLTDHTMVFPLSGGKDSRLLLALLLASGQRERLADVYTNGPSSSPEVIAAREVCVALSLRHRNVDSTSVAAPRSIQLSDKLEVHLRITEGEMSPLDLLWQRSRRDRTVLMGQEGGLRNISGKREFHTLPQLLSWFRTHMGNGDTCGIFRPGAADDNLGDIDAFVTQAIHDGVELSDVPVWHRVKHRLGRWVARTWKAYNDIGFYPYPLVDSALIRATFNAGARSRYLEEFHFEMIRRSAPALLALPFAGQSWDPEIATLTNFDLAIVPSALSWPPEVRPEQRRPTHEAIHRNSPSIVRFVQENAGPTLVRLIDFARLARFSEPETLKDGHYQPLWQVIQWVVAEQTLDFAALRDAGHPNETPAPVDVIV